MKSEEQWMKKDNFNKEIGNIKQYQTNHRAEEYNNLSEKLSRGVQ